DRYGAALDTATRTLAARAHLAVFAGQLFPDLPDGFTGLIEISSTVAVNPITLLETDNARGDQVLTTLPVADLTRVDSPASLVFPQIAIGSGFSTRLILINRSSTAASSGSLAFYQSDGSPMVIPLGDTTGSALRYELRGAGGRQYLPGNTS